MRRASAATPSISGGFRACAGVGVELVHKRNYATVPLRYYSSETGHIARTVAHLAHPCAPSRTSRTRAHCTPAHVAPRTVAHHARQSPLSLQSSVVRDTPSTRAA